METDGHLADDLAAGLDHPHERVPLSHPSAGGFHGPRDGGQTASRDGVDWIVDQWAHERPDLDTTAMAVFDRIADLSRIAGERVERAYAEFGIGRPEFDVLSTLRRAGDPFQLSPGELAASMMLSTGGTTARLDRLEKAGLIERLPSPSDRRSVLVRLTEAGYEVVERAVGAGLAEQQRLLEELPSEKLQQLDELLREVLRVSGGARVTGDARWWGPARDGGPGDARGGRGRGRGRS
ncbi:MarR family winged helix-turn-helix transcriptional regulator [Actinoplanes sp. NPDC048988]|uniref:MarR family winged helix-turn-helix transcriptional regulator n=1 Tax=Actinoplanes sp. NPDC048988 TaxID=3363901 RepID=UPI003714A410